MRVGIIGSGFGLYGLLPAFNAIPQCEVVALCGKKSERLTSYCASIGLTHVYTSWEKMFEKEQLDAVVIAVVPSAQYVIAKKALEKGLHVFAEKPLTTTYKESVELLALATKKKVTTVVDFIFLEIDEWQEVKKILDAKTYGKLCHMDVSWDFLSYDIKNKIKSWKTDVKEGGGALSFYGSHTLYYLEYFAGTIQNYKSTFTYSKTSKNGAEVGVDLVANCISGVTANVHISCNSVGIASHRLTFICEQGTIVLESKEGVTSNFTITIYTQEGVKKITVTKSRTKNNKKNPEDERVLVVKKLATRFVEGCISKKQIIPSMKEGVRVQKLIEEIRKMQK